MIGNKKIIGLCITRIQDEASNDYVTALHQAVTPMGYGLFVYNTCSVVDAENYEEDAQSSIFDFMHFDVLDIVVIFEEVMKNAHLSKSLVARAKEHNLPVIVIGEAHEGCINIKFDHENGFAQIVRHMVCDHKLTDLHFIAGGKGDFFSEQRLKAFRDVLIENGLPFDDSMVSYGDFWSDPAIAAVEKLIEEGRLPQAIICANDKMAIAVSGALENHGIQIPQQVAVTGFDGILDVCFSSPRITTVVTDLVDLAKKTAHVIGEWDKWENKSATINVPLRIDIGASCGCQGAGTQDAAEHLNIVSDRYYRFQNEDIMLSQIIARIQRCDNVVQISKEMKNDIIYSMCCILEKRCLDETVNPIEKGDAAEGLDREMIVLYESETDDIFPYSMPAKQIIPHLEEYLEKDRPLIFTALYHLEVPMGYVCFFFDKLMVGNYVKVPQTVNALNNAIGGYRSARYKQYLMKQIDEMYRNDPLTGMRNRRGFELEYQELLSLKPKEQSLSIMLVDLDSLKYINDNYGHKEGDVAIYTVAQAMMAVCPDDALFTRFGGDEMLAICPDKKDTDKIKEDFYAYLDGFNQTSSKEYAVLASMGVYHTEAGDDLSFEGILEKTDILMYMEKAKRKKNRIR